MAKRVSDPFGFAGAVGKKKAKGYFALIEVPGKKTLSATPVYTKDILMMFIADNKLTGRVVKILPEDEFERITGRKP